MTTMRDGWEVTGTGHVRSIGGQEVRCRYCLSMVEVAADIAKRYGLTEFQHSGVRADGRVHVVTIRKSI